MTALVDPQGLLRAPCGPALARMKPDSNPLMSPILRKRARSPIHIKVQELQRHGCEDPDMDDNVRTKKRLLTEMIVADLSKLKVGQQEPDHPSIPQQSTWVLPSFPGFRSPSTSPRGTPRHRRHVDCRHVDSMECDDVPVEALESFLSLASPSLPPEPLSPRHPNSASVRGPGVSRLSLQQLQKEGHDSPSSPTDNKLGLDLRKAALIRSLLFQSCQPLGDPAQQQQQLRQQEQQQQQQAAADSEMPSCEEAAPLPPATLCRDSSLQGWQHAGAPSGELQGSVPGDLHGASAGGLRASSDGFPGFPVSSAAVQLTPPLFKQPVGISAKPTHGSYNPH